MGLEGVVIEKQRGRLGRKETSQDMVSGFITNGFATADFELNKTVLFLSIKAIEAVGITRQYDLDNKVLVWHHCDEFFRVNPDGQLYLMLVEQSVLMSQMADKDNPYAAKMISDAEGKIRQLAIGRSPEDLTVIISNGLDEDVLDAVAKAQELHEKTFTDNRPCFFIIEGRNFDGTVAACKDLRTLGSEEVCVVVAQDPAIASLDALFEKHAAVGTCLGAISLAKVNENIGWVEKFNMQSAADKRWLDANLSSGNNIKTYEDDLDTLTEKGYIFIAKYNDFPGSYFNDFPTCIEATDDYANGNDNRTIDKACRLVYKKLLPKVKSPQPVDPDTGNLDPKVVKAFEDLGHSALEQMAREGEISGKDIFIDPAQNLLSSGELLTEVEVIPTGTAKKLRVKIGFKNPFNKS